MTVTLVCLLMLCIECSSLLILPSDRRRWVQSPLRPRTTRCQNHPDLLKTLNYSASYTSGPHPIISAITLSRTSLAPFRSLFNLFPRNMASSSTPTAAATMAEVARTSPPPAKKQKLGGYEFYVSIGSPKWVVAPMVDQSELVSFRHPVVTGKLTGRHGE